MNTLLIAHRINSSEDLARIPTDSGVEIDLRDSDNGLILNHDPFFMISHLDVQIKGQSSGELFEDFISNYNHKTLILNIKSERIEYEALRILDKYKINDYFFLDSSLPMIIELSNNGIDKLAGRVSEYESLESLNLISERISWIWLDSFDSFYLTKNDVNKINKLNLKTCLVSPELQGREQEIETYSSKLKSIGLKVDAVCTKFPNFSRWSDYLGSS